MTDTTSYVGGTTADNFTLFFNGLQVGDFIEDFDYRAEFISQPAERELLWADTVVLDNRYSANVYRHTFKVYTATGSLGGLFSTISKLNSLITSDPATLAVHTGTTSTILYSFGPCYYKPPATLQEPNRFNRHKVAFFEVSFVGNTLPVVN